MKKYIVLGLIVVGLFGCAKSSTGRNQIMLMSESDLSKMGVASFEEMKKEVPISSHKETNAFVQCVADAITKNVPKSAHSGEWEVVVFDSAQVNAFALPGGKIGVYTGILNVTENQDQLAAIMGHEVGHVIEHHSNERLSANKVSQVGMAAAAIALGASDIDNKGQWMAGLGLGLQYGIIMPYGRSHESEADIVGQDLMARSGFKPEASIHLWQNMAKLSKDAPPEFMSTHPSNETRITQLTQHLKVSEPMFNGANRPNCIKPKHIPEPPKPKAKAEQK
ncbi:M48 family metallopeptidase [Thalassotalea sp. PLHSN55]|uniref:M48 family metallopeptidase n=1 Tax=Thalassotalea sp. PLHSN55 TaxID=3435888 RepID=UPI003F86D893